MKSNPTVPLILESDVCVALVHNSVSRTCVLFGRVRMFRSAYWSDFASAAFGADEEVAADGAAWLRVASAVAEALGGWKRKKRRKRKRDQSQTSARIAHALCVV